MNPGRIGASALKYWTTRQTVAANNLANVSTPGFKGEQVFAQLLNDATTVAGTAADFTAGSMQPTGRALDVAIEGDGFFVVQTPGGERWVRGGAFSADREGQLIDAGGNPVLGHGGPIILPPGTPEITEFGEILVDGASAGRIKIERAPEGADIVREGANLWVPAQGKTVLPELEVQVHQGHLESSNVDSVSAMVDMIDIQRTYAAIQRSMVTWDGTMQTITNEIGRLG